MAAKDVCLAHSGTIAGIKSNGEKLDHVIALLEAQQATILENDKRITKIYTVVTVISVMGGTAMGGLTFMIKQGWI